MTIRELKEPTKDTALVDNFVANAFIQVKDLPPRKGGLHGNFFTPYVTIFQTVDTELQNIQAGLPPGILKPIEDMGKDNYKIYEALPIEIKAKVDATRGREKAQITALIGNQVIPTLLPEILKIGTLETPQRYYRQQDKRTCGIATFCMMFEEITGQPITEKQILEAARIQGLIEEGQIPGEFISDEILVNLFRTKAFKEAFPGIDVRPVSFFGCDFDDISSALAKLREKYLGIKALCKASIKSEITQVGWHSVILLSADENQVIIHDPSNRVGSAFRSIPKREFIERWGNTFLSGELLLLSK